MHTLSVFCRLCLLAGLLLAGGCTFNRAVHQTESLLTDLGVVDQSALSGGHHWVLPRGVSWLVAVPAYGPDAQADARMARALAAALRQEFAAVYLAPEPANLQQNLQMARQLGAQALVRADMLHYGDGAWSWSEWLDADPDQSTGRSQLAVRLVIYDALSGRAVDSMQLQAHEGWWPSVSEQRDALMAKAFGQFVARVAYKDSELPR